MKYHIQNSHRLQDYVTAGVKKKSVIPQRPLEHI